MAKVRLTHNLPAIVTGLVNGAKYNVPPGDVGFVFDDLKTAVQLTEDYNNVAVNKANFTFTDLEEEEALEEEIDE